MVTPRSQTRTSNSLSSGQPAQTGFFRRGRGAVVGDGADDSCMTTRFIIGPDRQCDSLPRVQSPVTSLSRRPDVALADTGMGPQYVYTMKGLSKAYASHQAVLKDIWLSFLPGRQDRCARP